MKLTNLENTNTLEKISALSIRFSSGADTGKRVEIDFTCEFTAQNMLFLKNITNEFGAVKVEYYELPTFKINNLTVQDVSVYAPKSSIGTITGTLYGEVLELGKQLVELL